MSSANATKEKEEKKPKPRFCSICKKAGHTRLTCPENTGLAPYQQKEKEDELVQQSLIVSTNKKTAEGELLKKCKYPSCKTVVDETGYGPYCTQTCAFYDRKRINAQAKSHDKYQKKFAGETLREYLKEVERSHLPLYADIQDNLVPIKRTQLPSVAGYATYLGFAKVTLKSWANKHSEFRAAMLLLKQVQEYYLTNYGGTGMYNSKVVTLLLMNNHGMKDRSERTYNHLFGVVREVYEKADAYEQDGALDDPFEGMLGAGEGEDEEYI